MNIYITKKDIIWNYASRIFQISSGIFLLPIILKALNSDELAIWYVFLSVTALINLLDFGFQQTILRNISYVFSGADKLLPEGIKKQDPNNIINYNLLYSVIQTARKIYGRISIIAFMILCTVGLWYVIDISVVIINQKEILRS